MKPAQCHMVDTRSVRRVRSDRCSSQTHVVNTQDGILPIYTFLRRMQHMSRMLSDVFDIAIITIKY